MALVLDVHDPAVKETLKLMAPRALGLGVTRSCSCETGSLPFRRISG